MNKLSIGVCVVWRNIPKGTESKKKSSLIQTVPLIGSWTACHMAGIYLYHWSE